jgi:ketosteroid isomerase-like protein
MSSQHDIDLVTSLYAAFQRGDIEFLLQNMSEDIDWGIDSEAEVPWFGLRRGREGARGFFTALTRDVEFTRFEPGHFAAADGMVYCSVPIAGKLRNGEVFEGTELHVFTVRGGKVTAWHGYTDTAGMEAAYKGVATGKAAPSGVAMPDRPRS